MPLILNRSEGSDRFLMWEATEDVARLECMAQLDYAEKEQFTTLKTDSRKRQWLPARIMAHDIFGQHISYRDSGQPYLENSPLHISISHTGDYIALVASEAPCGVDLEEISRPAQKIQHKFAAEQELQMAGEVFPANPALLIWSAKESLYKMVRKTGVEFKTELLLEKFTDDTIMASACARKAVVRYGIFEEKLLITQAKYIRQ